MLTIRFIKISILDSMNLVQKNRQFEIDSNMGIKSNNSIVKPTVFISWGNSNHNFSLTNLPMM